MTTLSEKPGYRTGTVQVGARRDIQALRALAVSAVVLYHASEWPPAGFLGVDIFFVVSGYLITSMLLREHHATGAVRVRAFYARRVRRLLPSLSLMLTTILALTALLPIPVAAKLNYLGAGLAGTFGVSNLYLLANPASDPMANPFLHTWSLGVEEQYYLVLPAALLLMARALRRSIRAALVVLAVLSLASLAGAAWLSSGPGEGILSFAGPWIAFALPITRAWELALGTGIALWQARRVDHPQDGGGSRTLLYGGSIALVGSLFVLGTDGFPTWATALPVLATGCVVISGFNHGAALHPVVLWIGDRSYAWYLWHWPLIIVAVSAFEDTVAIRLAAAVLSLGVAAAAYRYVEQPARHHPRWRSTRGMYILTIVSVSAPVVVGLGALVILT